MISEKQINRSDLFWLMLSFAAVVALQLQELPFWILAVIGVVLFYRYFQYRGFLARPSRPVKLGLILACFSAIGLHYQSLIGLEPMLALLVSGAALKFIEMHNKRDAFILICAGFFIAPVACIFSQEIFNFLLVLGCFFLLTATLVAIQQERHASVLLPLRKSTFALIAAVPLMVMLFVVMPRVGALWSIPGPKNQAVTGLNSSMSPGDITELGRSPEVAFRARFDGDIPAQNKLYWRGIVLTDFDGKSWQQSSFMGEMALLTREGQEEVFRNIDYTGSPVSYEVILQPTNARWLLALDLPEKPNQPNIFTTRDIGLVTAGINYSRFQYQVKSWLDYRLDQDSLGAYQKRRSLELPEGFNPETRRIAASWASESKSPEELIGRVLRLFNQSFIYTLKPPPLGKDSVDEFLWQSRQGFCEHFASSFVFFMRAAGIPARVVTGYQGGELHPEENFLTVRQYDAHAWAEVWLENKGWLRIDPTAAVAPERIETSFSDYLASKPDFFANTPFSLAKYRRVGLLNWLQLKLDSLDYAWAVWVLGYERQQQGLLETLLGQITPFRIAVLLVIGGGLTILPLLWVFGPQKRSGGYHPLDRCYLAFCKKMAAAGFPRATGEGPRNYAIRLAGQFPLSQNNILSISNYYINHRFNDNSKSDFKEFKRVVREFDLKQKG